ncbi:threonine-phosphate decarboxylase CobD [Alloalcanivorax gelatiniphagus]|uniref:threonine-phosphate decarboxylase n=1 Tax=Alloalcanivorax gelatiniphagus TaxID=1194167 RepID=A0ABY2XKJ2_9GAMM|nr:threonine-phosphate decarboxylase CobD [Alloalcanivorax gelatiniphagus]TMW11717.1 threonine-phosphate decarboxylase [Alloalcanivorax gelatiniphagus]
MSGPRPDHGGRLNHAARHWGIPASDWLDLSTGINPHGYPVPAIPERVWRRLPEDDDGLETIARTWLDLPAHAGCLPVAGSQAALQTLPWLRRPGRVGVPAPGYQEHAAAWQRAGHRLVPLTAEQVPAALPDLDALVWIHPNNPTGATLDTHTLLGWHRQLAKRDGWLLVDEAFIEASPATSLVPHLGAPGLVVLRSLGKFFGLAGLRAGLMAGPTALCRALDERLGPWALSHPARHVMATALADRDWQADTRRRLRDDRQRLDALLQEHGLNPQGDSDLFAWCPTANAAGYHQRLARQAVLTRLWQQPDGLRLGLPGDQAGWRHLAAALAEA